MQTATHEKGYNLTAAQKSHFLDHGFIKLENCFTESQAAEVTSTLWTRLGYSPTDKSTWTVERTNMPWHNFVPVSEFSPKAWTAMCDLLGGEDRISDTMRGWADGFIVNLGKEEYNPEDELNFRELEGWHNDGDFFVHHLDSPEQALLVIPLYSDIVPKGGGTVICTDGIKHVAKLLYDHPEGVTPWMKSVNDPDHAKSEGTTYWNNLAKDPSKTRDEAFYEMTGNIGDVILMHPFMLHTASKNLLRRVRVITNPPVSLKEPFLLNREKQEDYSIVELKTLRELEMPEGVGNWKIGENSRKKWISNRARKFEVRKREELERLKN